jgi:outer membrane receptor for ferrienterochelin and colicins
MQRVLIPARDPAQARSPTDDGRAARSVSHGSASRHFPEKFHFAIWMFLLGLFYGCPVAAQQAAQDDLGKQSMEDLVKMNVDSVYGATKFLQKAEDAASSISVVTAEEIQKHGYRTLAEVLKSIRGFYVINDRNYSYVGVRGLSVPGDYNARILFLVDGHRVNDNIFDGAYVSTEFPVDIDLIERIEIIRGPDSSAYGTGAFAAVINVITKRGRDLKALEISAEAGSLDANRGRISFGNRFDNGLETLISGTFYNRQGNQQLFFPEFNSPATNNGIAENADGDQSGSVFADIIYRDFNIHVVGSSRTKHIPTASFGTVFDDPRTRTTDDRRFIDAQYHHTFGSWETLGRLSYDWYGYHGIYIYDYAGLGIPPFTQNYDVANGTWIDFQGDASRVFFKRHHVSFGMEFRQDLRQQQTNYDIQPYHLYFDDHRSTRLGALYFQDKYFIRNDLSFIVGLRSDWYDFYGNELSPRAGLHYDPTPNTDLKANYSWAFRPPNDYEAFYAGNNSNTADPFLKPEKIRSWELDLEHRFGKTYSVSGAGFLNQINSLIVPTLDPVTNNPIYTNSTEVETRGIEYEFSARWPGGLEGSISHTIQDTRVVLTGEDLANSPGQLVKASLSIPLLQKKLFASVHAQYTGRVITVSRTELGGYFLVNATVFSRKITEKFDLSGGFYNLLNKKYANTGGLENREVSIPQDGRSFRIKLTYRPYMDAK